MTMPTRSGAGSLRRPRSAWSTFHLHVGQGLVELRGQPRDALQLLLPVAVRGRGPLGGHRGEAFDQLLDPDLPGRWRGCVERFAGYRRLPRGEVDRLLAHGWVTVIVGTSIVWTPMSASVRLCRLYGMVTFPSSTRRAA